MMAVNLGTRGLQGLGRHDAILNRCPPGAAIGDVDFSQHSNALANGGFNSLEHPRRKANPVYRAAAERVSAGKRTRFTALPPNASSRVLSMGEINWLSK